MVWNIRKLVKEMPKLRKPVMVEGLPGIGNVGKITVDFMIDELQAVKFMEIQGDAFPHSVFVNEENLVKLPVVELFYKRFKNKPQDMVFVAGDVQPIDEVSSYQFAEKILDIAQAHDVSEIVTIGGIGLPQIPELPKVYCTGNSKVVMKKYCKDTSMQNKLYGVVGPIIGVTGLLIGLAERRKIPAICMLAETYGHPLFLGMKGSQEVLKVLKRKLGLTMDLNALEQEIKDVEDEILLKTKQLNKVKSLRKFQEPEASYIG